MAKRPTFMTTGDISKYTKAPNLLERVMKTIRKIATASAVAFSAFALTVTPGSAARVGRSMTPPQQYCMYYDEGGTDCSFISYAQCWATASGQAGGCYANSPSDDEGFRGARAQMSQKLAIQQESPQLRGDLGHRWDIDLIHQSRT